MNFFKEDYKVPTSGSKYMKFEKGENKFRVLSESPITGYEYWTNEPKPVRSKEIWESQPKDIKLQGGQTWQQAIKHFWAMVVWNYKTEQVEILEITQKSVQTSMKVIIDNAKWGHPSKYDLVVTRDGDGMDTNYNVISEPPTDIDIEIQEAFEAKPVNLDALYEGGDPFQTV